MTSVTYWTVHQLHDVVVLEHCRLSVVAGLFDTSFARALALLLLARSLQKLVGLVVLAALVVPVAPLVAAVAVAAAVLAAAPVVVTWLCL